MININLFSNERTHIDYKVIKYINDNIKSMIEVCRDYLHMEDGFDLYEKLEWVFPRQFLSRNKHICEELIEELYEIIASRSIRDYIKPKYEFALYYIMKWWVDIQDNEEDCIPIKLSEELKKCIEENCNYIDEYGENLILNQIKEIENYFVFCFEDHDFLTESLDSLVTLYLKEPKIVENLFHIELDDYKELMSSDLRELYLEKRITKDICSESVKEWTEELLIKEIYNNLKILKSHVVEIVDKSEVEISNEIFRMNKLLFKKYYGLELEREAEIGHAKKKLGETDLYIYQNNDEYINIAIGENKVLEKFNDAYGQVLGYLNHDFKFGFTISINKDKNIIDAYKYIIKKLQENKYRDFEIIDIIELPLGYEYKYLLKSTHRIPEDRTRTMNIYHLILDLNTIFRKNVAVEARKK